MINRKYSACLWYCGSYLPDIDDLGLMPFRLAKPLLAKVQTAAQLVRIACLDH